jgi:hypothetical protein
MKLKGCASATRRLADWITLKSRLFKHTLFRHSKHYPPAKVLVAP